MTDGRGVEGAAALFHSVALDGKAPQVKAIVVQWSPQELSCVGLFQCTYAVDCTIVICRLCIKFIKCGNTIGNLGTTCIKGHMTSHHTAH